MINQELTPFLFDNYSETHKQMNLKNIAEDQFCQLDGPRRVISMPDATCFLLVDLGRTSGVFGIGWCSELVPPSVTELSDNRVWFGADTRLAVVDSTTGEIQLSVSLPSNFQKLYVFEDARIVLCETDLLVFNLNESLRTTASFNDVVASISRSGTVVSVITIGKQKLTVNI